MFLNSYLQKLSKFQLFQLYTIISIAIIYPYFLFIDNISQKKTSNSKNLEIITNNIKKIKKKIEIPKTIKVLKEFEKESKKYKFLKLKDFNITKKNIKLIGIGSKEEFFKFLIYCENYSNTIRISSLSFKAMSKSNLYSFSLELKFKKKYLKTLSKDQISILEKKIFLDKTKKTNKIKLQAILGNQVIIDNELLSKGDKYKDYKIKEIKKDFILLSKGSKIKKVYIKENKDE